MSWSRRLRLRHLQFLISLSETGSLSDTAKQLHATQPGLSKWLKELEEDVGGELFERHSRGLVPTRLGELLIGHAQRIISEIDKAQGNLDASLSGALNRVVLGTSPASAPTFVPMAVRKYIERFPKTRIELIESTMDTLLDKLEAGKVDLVIGRLDNYQPREGFSCEILYGEVLRVIARKDHPLVGRQDLEWEELYQYDWIVWPSGAPIRSKFDHALTTLGKTPPNYRIESSSQVGNLWLLQNSDMLSIGSEKVTRHFFERGLIAPLDISLEGSEGKVGMCWRDEAYPDPNVLALMACLRECAG